MAQAAPFIIMGAQVVGGLVKASGDLAAANTGSSMTLQTARMNQTFLQQQADKATELARIAYQRSKRQGLIYKGRSIAMMADAGIDVQQGTPLDILSQQAAETEYSAEVQRFNYAEQAWKLSTQGMLEIERGDVQSEFFQQQGKAGAIGDIIGGITGAASTAAASGMFKPGGGGGGGTIGSGDAGGRASATISGGIV